MARSTKEVGVPLILHLEDVLQRVYDSGINVTITMLSDGGFEFALACYAEIPEIDAPMEDLQSFIEAYADRLEPALWHNCAKATELAGAIHEAVLRKFPESDYSKTYKYVG